MTSPLECECAPGGVECHEPASYVMWRRQRVAGDERFYLCTACANRLAEDKATEMGGWRMARWMGGA